jgi:hypothetical protein
MSEQSQSFKNHSRFVPLYHYVTGFGVIAILGGSIVNFILADEHTHYSAALILVISIVLISFFWYGRAFALRAQDRAIRAEENFRHFILTGKPLDSRLRMSQIIALRFAADGEFPELAKRAVEENMPQKEIKRAIKNWKGDYNRA